MPDVPKPLLEVIADEATDELLKMKIAMTMRGEVMKKSHVRAVLAQVMAKHWPAKAAPRRKPYNAMTEAEFIACLEAEPSLAGVDIKKEIGKCQFWCRCNQKQPTRARTLNWLNRAERTLAFNGAGATSKPTQSIANGIPEPRGWQQWVRENVADTTHADKPWASLDHTQRKYIAEKMKP
jgi:hypothetical protein